MQTRRTLLTAALLLARAQPALAQDPFAESRIGALKGLANIALVFRANSSPEVYTPREWADLAELALQRNAPDLRVVRTDASSNWLEMSIVSGERGGAVEIALHRWVKVTATGEEIAAKVWSQSKFVFGSSSRQDMRDLLESLLLAFAADYSRAKRR